ncbi:putative polyketide synthase [Aspergillus nomiae NRRL 13137]|uniref:Putative polyketide synthase n=1 Tax=Aspergillus nomiae NRRL (strain ATCC 15546 / NRRL 13137 / CBS 260.88 / M93) TaxID=1509407 RepID=A0A0L1JHW6_ASPN3|nr:putative polyketide synthase [Aspergillus nomiae NRRL 13137]KNG91356.1 putative polyketide synthase [Aspergillus nomiae NRRL 13137]
MASQLKPPPGGKTVLIFGCQCVSFTIDDFHRLRATVLSTPEHRWIQDVVSELPVYYRTAATTYVQKLQNIPGTQQLRDLTEWFRTGEVPTDSFPLTYIQLAPILMITHFMEYWQYLRLGHPKSPTSGNEPLTEGSVVEIVGFCIGFLSAAVVSAASNQEELRKYGAVALRLATLMGAIGDAQEREEEYTSLATVWKSADLEKRLPLILKPFAESYITVRFDANRATIMTPRQKIKQIEEALQSAGFNTTRVEFNGRYHWAGNEDIVHALCRMCDSDPALQLPGPSQSVNPTRPGISMDTAHQGPLHEFVLRSILAQQCQWLDTFCTVYQAHLEDTSSIIVEFGPERCIPPTYMRKLRGRTVHFADLDLSPLSRTSPLHQTPRSYDSDIAVVGMACRVAGADDLEEFWKLLCSGESQHQEMPLERYRNYETPWRPDAIKPWFGNFVRDIDAFDHKFFKKVPREAMSQDPQQRLLLQVAYQAVQQSGYFHQPDINRNIGCYIASCTVDYEHNVNCNPVSAYSATGLLRSFMAGKLSHYFGWRGPAFCVDSACSGSAVALHQACQSIIRGECTAALVGGANAIMSPLAYDNLAGASFVSPTGPCKPFDASADGYCRGEGFAAIFIKKMSEALASGDIILGTIASTAVEQNSNCTPIVVPDACSLAGLFTQVTRQAHLHPRDISVVEAHGTGTQAGDPAEYVSIRKTLAGPRRTIPLALGSVKGLIGHTEGVSGLVSLVKILLMINEGKIPPQPNFHTLNRHIEASPDDQMHIPMTLKDWTGGFRAALINNYGASGSNASMVITEAPGASDHRMSSSTHASSFPLPIRICASDDGRLSDCTHRLHQFLHHQVISAASATDFGNLSFNICRQSNPTLESQLAFCCCSQSELASKLCSIMNGDVTNTYRLIKSSRPVVLCFGGQVSTFVGLDRTVYDSIWLLRHHLGQCDSLAQSSGCGSLFPSIFEQNPITDHVQLHIQLFSLQYSCARCWMDSGLSVAAVVGHSFGELTALCICGALSLRDAITLIARRAAIIRDGWGPDHGSMIVVEGNKDDVLLLIDDAYRRGPKHIGPATIACFNGPSNFTLAGATAAIDAVQATLKAPSYASLKAKRLCVTNAFHSGLVEPLLPAVKGVMSGINPQQPIILCERATRSSCTATISSSTVAEHLREPVYFHHAVQRLEERYGPCVWVEAGSNSTITVMVSRALSSSSGHHFQAVNITSGRGMQSLSDSTVSLWKASVSVTFWAHHPRQSRDYAPILLPPYQFEKSRHWLSNKSLPGPSHEVGTRPAIDASALRFVGYQDSQQLVARFNIDIAHPQYQELIAGHVVSHTAPVAPASLMLDYVVEALRRLPECKGRIPQVQNVTSDAPLCLDMSRDLWIELHAQDTHKHIWDLRYLSEQRQKGPRSQVLHCSARFNMFDPHDAQICSEFARYSRLVSHHHCTELLNDPNISEIIQGRNVYRTFAEIVDYSEPYRGVQKLVGSDNESAGRVVKRYTGQTWADTCLCDSFSQVGGFWVNCMTDRSPSDMYLASGMERWMRSPIYADPATPRPDTWDILARHEQKDDYYTSDIFVFDPTTGQLIEIFLGMKYTKVKKATFSKIIGEFMPRCATRSSDGGKPQLAVSHPAVPAPGDAGAKSKLSQQSSRINLTARVKAVVANFCAMDPNEITEDGNMADAGVDSLMAMELAREMEEAFQCTLPAANLMEADTFRDLVDCVKAAVGECDNDEQDNSNWSLEDTSSKDSSPDRDFNTPNTEPGTSVASDTPDLELPLRSVLEAFGETKALTDRFLEENKCSGRIQIFAPLQIELCITLTLEAFEQLGCHIRTASRGQCLDRIPFDPQHQELVDYLYKRLEEAELVHLDGNTVIRTAIPAPNKSSLSILEEIKCSYPEYAGASKLAHFTGSKLASVLCGEQDGLQLIFGTKEGQELVSWMYGDEPHNIVGYLQMIDFIKRLIKKVPVAGAEVGPLRILEMGAGTGGGTKWFLPVLAKLDISVEYTFTDISTAFIAQARRRFKEHSFVRYRVHDIEKPPADDLIGTQHIIIASNAVHATSNLQESTRNMRAALRPDGVVLMLEMTRPAFAIDIVFGLFRGWWVFNDGRNHAITNEQRWEADMHTVGYGHVDWTDGHSPEVSVQRVIFATATGTQSQRLPLGSPIERVHPESQADNNARNKVITEYIRRSIEDFTPPTASRSGFESDGQVVLLTGATGSLGCHIMAHLARQQSVSTIFCLNRTKGNDEPLQRQTSELKKRGICLAAHELSKVKVLGATTYHSNLGLSSEQYDTLKTTVTHIIHNAWPMNGASDVSGFERQFQVMRHLVDLANDIACHCRKDSGVRFQFVSSIATVGHYPSITSQSNVPEQSTNIEFVLPNGYSEAKFICERILEETLQRYPNRFQAMIVRPGQIVGCSSSGCWKIAEHFPAIVKSAQTLKLLPDLQGALSWTPVNEIAASLVELLVTENTPFPVYHLDNPVRQRWHNMIALLASELGIPTSSIVPFSEWIQRVRTYPGSAEDNPARLMADWLEENFERMSCGGVLLETTRAKEHSSTLARVGPVSDETARRYLHNWKQCGFLH